jgi:hypothetical protein
MADRREPCRHDSQDRFVGATRDVWICLTCHHAVEWADKEPPCGS